MEATPREFQKYPWTVWVAKGPTDCVYIAEEFLEYEVEEVSRNFADPRTICIRYRTYTNSSNYGVLGATFTPNNGDKLHIRVGIMPEVGEGVPFNRVGLEREFAIVVFEETKKILSETNSLGSGDLDFKFAAWNEIDSFAWGFRVLTHCVLALLDPVIDSMGDEQIIDKMNELKARYK